MNKQAIQDFKSDFKFQTYKRFNRIVTRISKNIALSSKSSSVINDSKDLSKYIHHLIDLTFKFEKVINASLKWEQHRNMHLNKLLSLQVLGHIADKAKHYELRNQQRDSVVHVESWFEKDEVNNKYRFCGHDIIVNHVTHGERNFLKDVVESLNYWKIVLSSIDPEFSQWQNFSFISASEKLEQGLVTAPYEDAVTLYVPKDEDLNDSSFKFIVKDQVSGAYVPKDVDFNLIVTGFLIFLFVMNPPCFFRIIL